MMSGLRLLLHLMLAHAARAQLNNFLQFGQAAGDAGDAGDLVIRDGEVFDVPGPLFLFGHPVRNVQFSFNGFINFGLVGLPNPIKTPSIAPLMTNFTNNGTLYVSVDIFSQFERVSQIIESEFGTRLHDGFLLTITWYKFPLLHDQSLNYTFQLVLASGYMAPGCMATYAILIYDLPDSINSIQSYRIGFEAGNNGRFSSRFLSSVPKAINVFRVDEQTVLPLENILHNTTRFLPYGESSGDTKLLPGEPFRRFTLNSPFHVFRVFESSYDVFTNGKISFLNSTISPFELNELNTRTNGTVYHRITYDSSTLAAVTEMIAGSNSALSTRRHRPLYASITTWDRIPLTSYPSITAMFQAVLLTNGRISFAAFIYSPQTIDLLDLRLRSVTFPTIGFFPKRESEMSLRLPVRENLQTEMMFRIEGSCITGAESYDACPLNSEAFKCFPEDIRALSCTCDIGLRSPKCLDLFPYGKSFNDNTFPLTTNKSVNLMLNDTTLFYQRREFSLYILANGILSFQSPFTSFQERSFPSTSVPIIAPLWFDYEIRRSSPIYYRIARDQNTLDRFASIITEKNPVFRTYRPRQCVIVTWSEAPPARAGSSTIKDAYQVVLATDREVSFAALLYEKPSNIKSVVSATNAIIGFDAGDRRRGATVLSTHTPNATVSAINIYRIDGNCVTSVSTGDVCELRSTSLECEEDSLKAILCSCEAGYNGTKTCQRGIFDFGIGNRDFIGPSQDDSSVRLRQLSEPVVFYQSDQRNLFVSTNGLISFGKEFTSFAPTMFPRNSPPPIIAPLWADFNLLDTGTLYYRTDSTRNTLQMLSRSFPLDGYNPSLAVIATWYQSELFGSDVRRTFQVVIMTDGNISYAELHYENRTVIHNTNFPAAVGFDGGDGRSNELYINFLGGNRSEGVLLDRERNGTLLFRIDGHCVVPARNDRCGLNSVPIRCEVVEGEYTSTACLCNTGVKSNSSNTSSCLEYLQFGNRSGDNGLSLSSGSILSSTLRLQTPIIFNTQRIISVIISGRGPITLFSDTSESFFISPLSTRLSSRRDILYYRVAEDDATLAEVENMMIDFNENLMDFHPKLAVVSTWLFHNEGGLSTSSQSILATDGVASFAIFLYEHPGQINGSDFMGLNFTNQGSNESINLVNKHILRIDGYCITSASPDEMCGLNSVASECVFLNASMCTCKNGYRPETRLTCSDINECEERICSDNSTCINSPGSFNCTCKYGFTGNGTYCSNMNECETNRCHEKANCTDTIGSFQCMCNNGYEGDGINRCTDINECEDNSTCAENAQCSNDVGSFDCQCFPGFSGNGFTSCVAASEPNAVMIGLITAGLAVLLVLVALIIVIVVTFLQKKKTTLKLNREQEIDENNDYVMNLRNITVQSNFKHNLPKSLIIPSCNLKLGKTLGQGEFGIVYKGFVKSALNEVISDTVAVKTLRGFVQEELITDLLKECARMFEFSHPNVLTLTGVCLDGGPAPYIIMPFMANGSLLSYLKEERESVVIDPSSSKSDDVVEVQKKLIDMCVQVAKGMEYLASKRVIHRDLAARNCMIDVNFVIKVADFGLAESIDVSKDYFRQGQDSAIKLPIKWMALESINDGVFSEKSDVWSYGVTCWEIFSGGKAPYPGIHPVDLPPQLEAGYRMEKPLNLACDDELYSMMKNCWEREANSRPTFAELVIRLSSNQIVMTDYLTM